MSTVSDFYFELVSPEKCVFLEVVRSVILPAVSGDITVLIGHSSLLTTVKPGIITIELPCGDLRRYVVFEGVSDITPFRCTVLSETIFSMGEGCVDTLNKRIEEIQHDLDGGNHEPCQRSQLENFLVDLSRLRTIL
ncbi:ATP synthase F1 subunit epsilon [Candidatus Liberibacter sp.]|uniref:ATP synthase F1 subunit epsilon n=1 Tax=Candidatus Liberibacter sp. TaxID=34022 RepID=UPI0015F6671E|nr:ATP synthase F1 subunit epsilon [Candidatus Liberibacter sp.]MBA5723682.1 ATP synthase F1 subunit epsilon [Candidatus Liberibacter sp.]